MKKFIALEKFKEIKVIFILEVAMCILIYMLMHTNSININYWDWRALTISLIMWLISSYSDSKVCRDLPSLIGFGLFVYIMSWLLLNLSEILIIK